MSRYRFVFGFWLTFPILGGPVGTAFAAECPLDPVDPTKYEAPDYISPVGLPRCGGTIGKWTVCEICLKSSNTYTEQGAYTQSYPNSGTGLQPRATFKRGTTSLTVDGFFDGLQSGKAVFRVRFAPTTSGTWDFSTTSPDAGLSFSGLFTADPSASSAKGFLRRDPDYPQRFIWDNGTRPFLWGQTYYQIVNQARAGNISQWQPAVTNSAAYGMNKVRLLVSPWSGDARFANGESKAFKKTGGVLNRDLLDVDHWKALDQVESFLQGKGIVADLILFHDDDDDTSRLYGTDVQNQRYTQYTVARYAAFPNVIWSLSNEYQLVTGESGPFPDNQTSNDPWNDLGCLIRGGCRGYPGADPWAVSGSFWRPLSIHNNINPIPPRPRNLSYPCFEFFKAVWPSHVSLQTRKGGSTPDVEAFTAVSRNSNLAAPAGACPGLVVSPPATPPPRLPVIDDEYGYIGKFDDNPTADRTLHRKAVWAIAVGGGFGSTGSVLGPTNPNCGDTGICQPSLYTTWQDQPGHYGDIRAVMNFFNYLPNWWQMSSDFTIFTPGQSQVYALSEPGVRYVVYAALGGTVTVNLPAGPTGQWSWQICDPRIGFCDKALRIFNGGSPHPMTLPNGQDGAILITPTSFNAQVLSQSVPTTMVAGQQYPVSVTVENTGGITWSPIGAQCGAYRLAQVGSATWNPARTELPAPLSGGGQVTLSYNVVAPATAGPYNFQVQMVHECVEFFPDLGPNAVVTVQPAPLKKAQILAQNVPSTMVAGQAYPVSLTIQNVGNVTWSPIGPQCNAYRLAQVGDAAWNPIRVELPTALMPGQQVTLPFNVIAPAAGGTYNFQMKMVHECVEFFNDPGSNVAVNVACAPSTTKLCLQGGRFEVAVDFVNGTTQPAQTKTFSDQSGFFTFFDPANPEVGVKIVDGRSVNGKWWVFHGALTDRQYTVRVIDNATHVLKTYLHPATTGTSLCGAADTGAFFGASSAGTTVEIDADVPPGEVVGRAACVPSATRVCLLGGRFQVEVTRAGVSQGAVQLTDLSGVFWFFGPQTAEVAVKVLDGRGFNGKYWVYFGSLTDQSYQVAVTDTVTGLTKTYTPPAAQCGTADVNAF